jgi:altronate dehydratase small subunit
MEKKKAIVMKPNDNVATAVEKLAASTEVNLDVSGEKLTVIIQEAIPFGHKFAIREIAKDEKVIKYGEPIGAATQIIKAGQHTHVHNMVGCRGRGDLEGSQP